MTQLNKQIQTDLIGCTPGDGARILNALPRELQMHTLYLLHRMQYRDVMCQLIAEVGDGHMVKNDCGHRVGVFWECTT